MSIYKELHWVKNNKKSYKKGNFDVIVTKNEKIVFHCAKKEKRPHSILKIPKKCDILLQRKKEAENGC